MLTPLQQAFEYIKKSRKILIVLPQDNKTDAVAGGLALFLSLKKMGKEMTILSANQVPEKLKFLPSAKEIQTSLLAIRDFIISINTPKNNIEQIQYEAANENLKLILTSQKQIDKKQINFQLGPFKFDLIITIGTPDLESLGEIYEKNTELFFNQPTLNIDYQPANENYGQINLIDSAASSSSEIICQVIESLGKGLIDEPIATCLLTGLIDETKSFQSIRTRPQTLALASILINKEANKGEIIKNLYQSKPLNYLRLWGRAVSRLQVFEKPKTALLIVKDMDFIKTDTSSKALDFVLEETIENFPDFDFWIILGEQKPKIYGLVRANKVGDLQNWQINGAKNLKNNKLTFVLENKDLKQALTEIKDLIKATF